MTSRRRLSLAAVALLLATTGCLYSFSGGGGLPSHIQTVYVPPVDNQTTRFTLTERLTQSLLEAVRGRLGARVASENEADAVFRVALTGYRDEAVNVQAREGVGADVFQRQVTLVASAEILDRVRDETLWSSSSVTGTGNYAPEQESDEVAIEQALEDLLQKVVDGAQSQW